MSYTMAWQEEIAVSRADNNGSGPVDVYAAITDKQLVDLSLDGSETAFEQIFDRYKRLVASVAARYFHRPEQIEEMLQIVFSKVYFQLKNFRANHDFSLPGWLSRITTNACIDQLRSQQRKPENLLCEFSEEESEALLGTIPSRRSGIEGETVHRDLAEKLLAHVSAEDRAILQMLYAEEMTISDISEVTGWSNARIKGRAHRARHSLRKIMQKFM
jgi:RNA polymerase sigma-70 factor (ECF subfamily)